MGEHNTLAKVFATSKHEFFLGVAYDINTDTPTDEIYAVGYLKLTEPSTSERTKAIIIKFDSDLNILAKGIFDPEYDNKFNSVFITPGGRIYAVGFTCERSKPYKAVAVEFNLSSDVLNPGIIYNNVVESRFWDIHVNDLGDIFCVGYYNSGDGAVNMRCLIVKLTAELVLVEEVLLDLSGKQDVFLGVMSTDEEVYCCGWSNFTSETVNDALIVKYDIDLVQIGQVIYGDPDTHEQFNSIAVNDTKVFCAGNRMFLEGGTGHGILVSYDLFLDINTMSDVICPPWIEDMTLLEGSPNTLVCAGHWRVEEQEGLNQSTGDPNVGENHMITIWTDNLILVNTTYEGGRYDQEFSAISRNGDRDGWVAVGHIYQGYQEETKKDEFDLLALTG